MRKPIILMLETFFFLIFRVKAGPLKLTLFSSCHLGLLKEKNIYEEDFSSLFMLFFASSFSIEGSLDFFSS